jgi:hypothetical protein
MIKFIKRLFKKPEPLQEVNVEQEVPDKPVLSAYSINLDTGSIKEIEIPVSQIPPRLSPPVSKTRQHPRYPKIKEGE